MYIFITIVFIAELIIAFQLISLIIKADKKVCDINDCVTEFNPLAKTCMEYARCLSNTFSSNIQKGINFFKKQREKIVIKTLITISIYGLLIAFRLKKIKIKKIGKLIGAIRDIAIDLAV